MSPPTNASFVIFLILHYQCLPKVVRLITIIINYSRAVASNCFSCSLGIILFLLITMYKFPSVRAIEEMLQDQLKQ